MNLKHPFRLLSSIIPALALLSCGESDAPDPEPDRTDNAAYLALSVVTAELPDDFSRAGYTFDDPDNNYFEDPTVQNELIKTMRFIIVDGEGKVEHNVSIGQNPAVSTRPKLFKVKPNDTKTVYLIGNEASIPQDVLSQFSELMPGQQFPDTYGSVTLSRQEGQPLYADDQVIPMTEFHSVEIGDPQYDGDIPVPYESTLFVTRTAIKVTFTMNVSKDYPKFSPDLISTVSINQIADMEYLFPNNTSYDPAKTPVNGDPRVITTFNTPAAAQTAPYTFTWEKNGETTQRTFTIGTVYLPETLFGTLADPKQYTITLPVNGVDLNAALPNLPYINTPQWQALPRNTHVKVNINLNGSSLSCTVDVIPYAGIDLNPDFGFDEPWIRPPYIDDERPPWADLDE